MTLDTAARPQKRSGGLSSRYDGRGFLGPGITASYLGLLVLIPRRRGPVALGRRRARRVHRGDHQPGRRVAALQLTFTVSLLTVAINAVMGTLIAWVLVRDDFAGKRYVNALIDLPFALPTIVAGLTLLTLYGPRSPFGINLAYSQAGIMVALLFITLPFVVRSVQPVLTELDREMEEAGASLGASTPDGPAPHRPAQPRARHPRWLGPGLRPQHRRVRFGRPHRRATSPTEPSWGRSTSTARSKRTIRARLRQSRSSCWSPRWCC